MAKMAGYTFTLDENALIAEYEHIIETYNLDEENEEHTQFAQALARVYTTANAIECEGVAKEEDLDVLWDDIQDAQELARKFYHLAPFVNLVEDLKELYENLENSQSTV